MIVEAKAHTGEFSPWILKYFYLVWSICRGMYLSAVALETTRGHAYS